MVFVEGAPDWVFPVRGGGRWDDLRYALRSLVNVPHGRVWLFGACPPWAVGVEHVDFDQGDNKCSNTCAMFIEACERDDISETFIWSNDDFYCMKPTASVPVLQHGRLDAHADVAARRSPVWAKRLACTQRAIEATGANAISYELHIPLPVVRAKTGPACEVLRKRGDGMVAPRSVYGSLARIGGAYSPDVKVFDASRAPRVWAGMQWLSTSDSSFRYHAVGAWLRARFPDPSPYEIPAPTVSPRERRRRYQG